MVIGPGHMPEPLRVTVDRIDPTSHPHRKLRLHSFFWVW